MDRAAPDASPQPVRLQDYAPPPHLIDTVDLTVALDDEWTGVTAVLRGRRNPAAGEGAVPLVLNGQDQAVLSVSLNGRRLDPSDYRVAAEHLELPACAGAFDLVVECRIRPPAHTAMGALSPPRDQP